jgi:hypothetical protein
MQYFHLNFVFLFVDTFPLFSPNAFAKQQVAPIAFQKILCKSKKCINQYEVGYCTLLSSRESGKFKGFGLKWVRT